MRKDRRVIVRVILNPLECENADLTRFIESLRYAGIVDIHRHDETGMCFDIIPPTASYTNQENWANSNAKRLASFGFNAVKAPYWNKPFDEEKGATPEWNGKPIPWNIPPQNKPKGKTK